MSRTYPIQVVDLFAGPGGLGEGFSSHLSDGAETFEIKVSAEMETSARSTLRLRAFYRLLKREFPEALEDYYHFCETADVENPYTRRSHSAWKHADNEAQQIELGTPEGNNKLDGLLEHRLDESKPWVLIGGPPCQAYSIMGRARNQAKSDYRAENDHRHFLYREYLRIIQRKRPAIFVMENVKGILSSTVGGNQMFPQILRDLADPDAAFGESTTGPKYRICSLVTDDIYESGADPDSVSPANYIIHAERFGIPQARHRVILLGVSEEYLGAVADHKLLETASPSIDQVIGNLPPLRSTLTRQADSPELWADVVKQHLAELAESCDDKNHDTASGVMLARRLGIMADSFSSNGWTNGGLRMLKRPEWSGETGTHLDAWLHDPRLRFWLNHEARGHMSSDLRRYVYAAVFADVKKGSPKGHQDFDLPGLEPDHKNWKTGKFSDRFRVQRAGIPSTTITSHIAKDGHYFIHYDAKQCRSLTVREAARLQTFPDNYFFLGNRTQQFHQVGNAVPPLLARQIADVVARILKNGKSSGNPVKLPIKQFRMFETES
ncbi:DNA cytosine methyltransferase [Pseudomonas plecoglossicida]|uniref:DNA (cytosine-5-)-methyltransferase n=1 Tax=Pseudomonas plecoglossicida TaxID=70775 RepID=A0ABX4TWN1_PSEDL|nr:MULTISPECIES: DNA cytosine methyltransferase [Pseudomonas]AGA73025.1 DNA-cytosine methyltransferase [Pseudomonas putida HB3267]MCE0757075.1 DNA cytosine methyltransferase [Pseudomonas asiatica]MCE0946186.1 DNA cytosine methyltransferase [Pseudomonas asiatica]MCE0957360.1 DNA cytosine methyltransferase [Pseudomonas asiatica]MCE1032653.1 DNA cytosine methyltransferase [Pseudomonas asiatica]